MRFYQRLRTKTDEAEESTKDLGGTVEEYMNDRMPDSCRMRSQNVPLAQEGSGEQTRGEHWWHIA